MKQRIDEMLVERGLAGSLAEAGALVMAGEVVVGEQRASKPGTTVDVAVNIRLKTRSHYVSRGGDKLASVALALGLDFEGKTVLDVGASTGGFTDYALQNGAVKVIAVDVGTNQLDYKLRQDPRVVVREETDIRQFAEIETLQVDLAMIDVSFIKLEKILPAVVRLLSVGGLIAAMVKPQFEASKVVADEFKGVIADEDVRQAILLDFREQIKLNFEILGEEDSQLTGSKGNRERFFVLRAKR